MSTTIFHDSRVSFFHNMSSAPPSDSLLAPLPHSPSCAASSTFPPQPGPIAPMPLEQLVVGRSLLRLRLRRLDSHRASLHARPSSLLRAGAGAPGIPGKSSTGPGSNSPETRALAADRSAPPPSPSTSPRLRPSEAASPSNSKSNANASGAGPRISSSSGPSTAAASSSTAMNNANKGGVRTSNPVGVRRIEGGVGKAPPPAPIPFKDRLRNKINRNIKEAETVDELLTIYQHNGADFEHQNVANALHRFAKLYRGRRGANAPLGFVHYSSDSDAEDLPFVSDLGEYDEEYFDTESPFGFDDEERRIRMGTSRSYDEDEDEEGEGEEEEEFRPVTDSSMLSELLVRAQQLMPYMQPIDYSQVAWAMGCLGLRDQPNLLQSISRRAVADCTRLKSQDVANIMLTCGRLQYRNANLTNALADVSAGRLSRFKSQEIANLLWGYAKCNVQPGTFLLQRTAEEVVSRVATFQTKELVMVLWSLAALQYRSDALLSAFAAELLRPERVAGLSPQDLANTLWAYSRFRSRPSDPLTVALKDKARELLPKFKALELGQLMYAMAELDEVDPTLYNAVASIAGLRIQEFRQQELVLLVWSLGKVKYQNEELAVTVAEEARRRLESDASPFKPQAVANLLKSFARLGYKPDTLLPHVSLFARRSIRSFRPSEMSNLLYACAKLKMHDPRMISQVVSEVAQRRRDNKFPDSYLRSIISSVEALGYVPRSLYELLELPRGVGNSNGGDGYRDRNDRSEWADKY